MRPFRPSQLTGTLNSLPGFDSGCCSLPRGSLISTFGFCSGPSRRPLSMASAFRSSLRGNGSNSSGGSCITSDTLVPPLGPRAVATPYRTWPAALRTYCITVSSRRAARSFGSSLSMVASTTRGIPDGMPKWKARNDNRLSGGFCCSPHPSNDSATAQRRPSAWGAGFWTCLAASAVSVAM